MKTGEKPGEKAKLKIARGKTAKDFSLKTASADPKDKDKLRSRLPADPGKAPQRYRDMLRAYYSRISEESTPKK